MLGTVRFNLFFRILAKTAMVFSNLIDNNNNLLGAPFTKKQRDNTNFGSAQIGIVTYSSLR